MKYQKIILILSKKVYQLMKKKSKNKKQKKN